MGNERWNKCFGDGGDSLFYFPQMIRNDGFQIRNVILLSCNCALRLGMELVDAVFDSTLDEMERQWKECMCTPLIGRIASNTRQTTVTGVLFRIWAGSAMDDGSIVAHMTPFTARTIRKPNHNHTHTHTLQYIHSRHPFLRRVEAAAEAVQHNATVMEFPIKSNRERRRSKLSQINMHV